MKKIPLTQGKFALVDDEDFAELSKVKWCVSHYGYATRNFPSKKGGRRILYMHRVILKAKMKEQCDHINMNGLDNRRENLRICTRSENKHNSQKYSNNTSGFKGVTLDKRCGRFVANIKVNSRRIYLGSFAEKSEAALAYNVAALKYHGDFAQLNKL
jgi:hypothetical protein